MVYFVSRLRMKRYTNQAAKQQYIYQLGRRVFAGFIKNQIEASAKNNLITLVLSRNNAKCKQQVYQTLVSYSIYRKQLRKLDQAKYTALRQMAKQRVISSWLRCFNKRVSAKLLETDLMRIKKRIAFQSLILYKQRQEYVFSQMGTLKLSQVFQAVLKLINKKKTLAVLAQELRHQKLRRLYKTWSNAKLRNQRFRSTVNLQSERNQKRWLKQGVESFKRHANVCQNVETWQGESATKKQNLIWRHLRKFSQVSQQQRLSIATRQILLIKSSRKKYFEIWRSNFKQNLQLNALYSKFFRSRLRKLFRVIRRHSEVKTLKRLKQDKLNQLWSSRGVLITISKLHKNAKSSLFEKSTRKIARHHFQTKLFSTILQVFKQLRNSNSAQLRHLRQRRRHWTQKFMLKTWLKKSEKVLRRVRQLQKVKKISIKQQQRLALADWSRETQFLSKIVTAKAQFEQRQVSIQASRAVKQLKLFSLVSKIDKEQRAAAMSLYRRVILRRYVSRLIQYLNSNKEKNKVLKIVSRFRALNSLKKSFNLLQSYTASKRKENSAISTLRRRLVKLVLPKFMFIWHSKCQEKQHSHNLKVIAKRKHQQLLMMRSLKKMCEYTILRQQRQQVKSQVESLYLRNLTQKVNNELFMYCEQRQELRMKHYQLFSTIQRVNQAQNLKTAFQSLICNKISRQQSVSDFERERRLRLLGSIFYSLRDWSTDREINRSVQSILQNQTAKTLEKKFYNQWRLNFLEAKALEHATQRFQDALKRKCISQFRHNLQQSQRSKFFRQKQIVVLAVKVLEGLKLNVRARKQSQLRNLKAYQHLAQGLIYKGLKAFCLQVSRSNNLEAFRQKAAINTQREYIRRWDRQLQLKLMRSDAFSNCISLLTRRYFREWVTYSRLAQHIEVQDYQRNAVLATKVIKTLRQNRSVSKAARAVSGNFKTKEVQKFFKLWRQSTKYRIQKLVDSLSPSVTLCLQSVFNQIVNFNDHQKLVFAKAGDRGKKSSQVVERSPKINLWLNQLLVKTTLDSLSALVDRQLKRYSLRRIAQFVQETRVIEKHVERVKNGLFHSPQLQLSISAVLRIYVGKESRENLSLLKRLAFSGIFEVCKFQRRLRQLTEIQNTVVESRQIKEKNTYFQCWIESYVQKRQRNCVKVYLSQTYCDKLIKKALSVLQANRLKGSRRLNAKAANFRLRSLQAFCTKIFMIWSRLTAWRQNVFERALLLQSNRQQQLQFAVLQNLRNYALLTKIFKQLSSEIQRRHSEGLIRKSFTTLRQFVFQKQRSRQLKEVGHDYNQLRLAKKVIDSLKVNKVGQRQETLYSRKFAVFTAWKTLCREQRLLSQYLNECNYQSSAK